MLHNAKYYVLSARTYTVCTLRARTYNMSSRPQQQPTLRFCWDSGRHVLVSYDYRGIHAPIWRRIPYFYGNTIVPSEVVTVLDEKLRTEKPTNCTLTAVVVVHIVRNVHSLYKNGWN